MKTIPLTLDAFRRDLKLAMERTGYVQQDITREFGVSQGTISNLLSGRRGISGTSLLKLWPFVYPPESPCPPLRPDPAACPSPSAKAAL